MDQPCNAAGRWRMDGWMDGAAPPPTSKANLVVLFRRGTRAKPMRVLCVDRPRAGENGVISVRALGARAHAGAPPTVPGHQGWQHYSERRERQRPRLPQAGEDQGREGIGIREGATDATAPAACVLCVSTPPASTNGPNRGTRRGGGHRLPRATRVGPHDPIPQGVGGARARLPRGLHVRPGCLLASPSSPLPSAVCLTRPVPGGGPQSLLAAARASGWPTPSRDAWTHPLPRGRRPRRVAGEKKREPPVGPAPLPS